MNHIDGMSLGEIVSDEPALQPGPVTLKGRYVSLVPFSHLHFPALYEEVGGTRNARLWDYMLNGPFDSFEAFSSAMASREGSTDPVFFTIMYHQEDGSTKACGIASFLRIDLAERCVELGHLMYSPITLSRHPGASEVTYLMARYALEELGFRRFEWKCNNLNLPSKRAAKRLGFRFEGVFRKHMIVKGRNRDTAWYAFCDDDWASKVKPAMEQWLLPQNFDSTGAQREKLELIRSRLH